MSPKAPRLRAAPSPTGRVHIGNLRTFLYNFLYTERHGGKFILRIEDTDQKRKVEGGTEAIIEVLKLYGIEFDEGPIDGGDYGPYIQTERIDIYKKYADQLIESGHAYRCFCTEERLEKMREEQQKNGEQTVYDGTCRNLSEDEVQAKLDEGIPYVVRMKFPKEGYTKFKDVIYKTISVPNESIDDQVLVKSDGIPTYHFAVVIDDHLMGITHTVRGREYLADTPKNIFLYDALGWEPPQFIHVPHILKPEGKGKLGKRDGALPAIGYIKKGYLPEAILNYIALIGWSPDPKDAKQDEIYSLKEMSDIFDFSNVQKTGGRYDPKKLDSTSGKHIRNMPTDELTEYIFSWAENIVIKGTLADQFEDVDKWQVELKNQVEKAFPLWKENIEYFKKALELVKERLVYLGELPVLMDFFYVGELSWGDEDWRMNDHTKQEMASALEGVLPKLDEIFSDGDFQDHDTWERVVRGYADELGWKHGELFMAIRSATTGRLFSPPLLESFDVMGWDKAREFISQAILWLRS